LQYFSSFVVVDFLGQNEDTEAVLLLLPFVTNVDCASPSNQKTAIMYAMDDMTISRHTTLKAILLRLKPDLNV
jgi:hypothetical protein